MYDRGVTWYCLCAPPHVVLCVHSIKRSLLLAYQSKLLEIRKAEDVRAAEKAAAAAAAAAAASDAAGTGAGAGAGADVTSEPSSAAEEAAEVELPDIVVDRRAVYADLCSRITTRCDLLMRVSPVPVAVEAAPTALPQLSRTPSTDAAHDVKSVDEAAIQAWMTSHEAVVPLATATPDQRFTIVWKYVGGSWPAFV